MELPEVTVLKNGRYAFRAECPWEGKNGKKLVAFKFCSSKDWEEQCARNRPESPSESEHMDTSESERIGPEPSECEAEVA